MREVSDIQSELGDVKKHLRLLKVGAQWMSEIATPSDGLREMKRLIDREMIRTAVCDTDEQHAEVQCWLDEAIGNLEELHRFFNNRENALAERENELIEDLRDAESGGLTQQQVNEEENAWMDRQR